MGAVTDDEVIRKRLLIDGDGAGDDRRINLLVKSFIKWCNSGSQEEGYSQYQRMLSTLSQCEFSMGKTLLVYDMNLREMENYEKIYKEIECSIAGAHEKIAECKKQILQAKRIRKNRQVPQRPAMRPSDPMELELRMLTAMWMPRTQPGSLQEQPVLLTAKPSL